MNKEIEFGKRLKQFRERRNLSVVEVAGAVGIAQSTYREWELGRPIRGLVYVRLAHVLGVSLNELFGVMEPAGHKVRECLTVVQELERKIQQMLTYHPETEAAVVTNINLLSETDQS